MKNKTKDRVKLFLKRILIFFAVFLVTGVICGMFYLNKNGKSSMPDWCLVVAIIIAVAVSALYKNKRIEAIFVPNISQSALTGRGENFVPPKFKSTQTKYALCICNRLQYLQSSLNKMSNVVSFVYTYDEALDLLKKLCKLNKASISPPPQVDLTRLTEEFQWHLCDAIERNKVDVLEDIRGKYRNSVEYKRKTFEEFENAVDHISHRFSDSTRLFAQKAVDEIRTAADISPKNINSNSDVPIRSAYIPSIYSIDSMEGHAFEYFCANLLRKKGFINVDVTKGSGDQGVDVLAEKEGIKYAIQCKCYSSDLGNKPIQEVHAGKSIYNCQIGVVMTNRHFTAGAKQLAEANGVLLWDRDWLINAMETTK